MEWLRLEGTSGSFLAQCSFSRHDHPEPVAQDGVQTVLSVSRDGASPASMGNLCQCPALLTMRKFCSVCVSVCAHCLWSFGSHWSPGSVLYTLSLQAYLYISKRISQPFLIWKMLQFNNFYGLSQESLQYVPVSSAMGDRKLDTALQGWSLQSRGKGWPPLTCWQHSCYYSPGQC